MCGHERGHLIWHLITAALYVMLEETRVLRIDVCTYAVVQTVLQPTKDRSHVERCHRGVECVECRLSSANLFFVDAACNREERAPQR